MTETLTENTEVGGYFAAIREALQDLPVVDRDELLEDLEAHLHEVAAESGSGTLEASLGSPTAYAAELRASAGLDPAPGGDLPLLRRVERTVASSSLWSGLATVLERPWVRSVRTFIPTLRPAWWVLRGWLALFAVVVWLHGSDIESYRRDLIVPTYHYNWFIGFVAVLVAVIASVWLGLHSARLDRWPRRLVIAGNVIVVLCFLVRFGDFQSGMGGGGNFGYAPYPAAAASAPAPVPGILVNGRRPQNIYPYDARGHLLTGVRLFDDRGQPVQGLAGHNGLGQDLVRVLPSDAAGAIIKNEYPQVVGGINGEDLGIDTDGNPLRPPTAGPAAASAMVKATPMPTPTIFVPPMAGATPTPTP